MDQIKRRDAGIAYIADKEVMEQQKRARKLTQELNTVDRSDFEKIEKIVKELLGKSEIKVETVYDKVTIVNCKLPNGFVITESSGAVDKANYDEKIGTEICMERIENKLWELEGYVLAKQLYESEE